MLQKEQNMFPNEIVLCVTLSTVDLVSSMSLLMAYGLLMVFNGLFVVF